MNIHAHVSIAVCTTSLLLTQISRFTSEMHRNMDDHIYVHTCLDMRVQTAASLAPLDSLCPVRLVITLNLIPLSHILLFSAV